MITLQVGFDFCGVEAHLSLDIVPEYMLFELD